MHVLF